MRNALLAERVLIPFAGVAILILLLFATLVVILALVVVVVRYSRKRPAPPQPSPPVPPHRQIISRKCPKCGADLKAGLPEGLCPACLLQRGIATEGGAPPGTPAFTPPSLAELAKLFPQLEILEVIGQGGMGAVYKARQPALDRFVALKILAPRTGGDLDFSGRFSREARALAKLSHPNIVGVHDFGTVGQPSAADTGSPIEKSGEKPETGRMPVLHYFIMEFVDGPNLRQLEQTGKLTPREALQIIPQICAALQFAHDEGIVHRDIKPENVLLDKKGRVKIADFGLAKILGQEADFRLTGARDVMGTPHYMAPEQVEKPQEVDHRADIYSLGVVFYEMLTGELPLGKFDPPSHKVQIDVRLDEVVLRSLANNPDRRYQHVSEVRTDVESITQTSPRPGAQFGASALMASTVPPVAKRSSGAVWGIAIGAGAAIVFLAFLGLAAAIAIPNFVKARHHAQEVRRQSEALDRKEAARIAEAIKGANAPKTIVLTRPGNQKIEGSNDIYIVSMWTDSYLEPGEAISALVKQRTNKLHTGPTTLSFINWQPDNTHISSAFNWFFGGGMGLRFGSEEAQAAIDQLRTNFADKPTTLMPGKPLQLFSVTNEAGEMMAGYVQLTRSVPNRIRPGTKVEAVVHLRSFAAYSPTSPRIDYAAQLPPGYALRATANTGSVSTHTPAGGSEYSSSWLNLPQPIRPVRSKPGEMIPHTAPQSPRFDTGEEREAQTKALTAQLQELQDQGPISVVLGKPKRMFSITNGAGEVFQGFLEIIGPGTDGHPPNVNPIIGEPVAGASPVAANTPPPAPVPPPVFVPSQMVAPDQIKPPVPPRLLPSPLNQDSPTSFAEQPPVVVETFPGSGARDIAPGETEIRVRFSKPMEDGSWSWSTAWENSTPETIAPPRYLNDGCTCVMKVRLEPGRTYAWWLNSGKFQNFKDSAGRPAIPYLLIFQTKPK
jgi:serine/threonine protein kinase